MMRLADERRRISDGSRGISDGWAEISDGWAELSDGGAELGGGYAVPAAKRPVEGGLAGVPQPACDLGDGDSVAQMTDREMFQRALADDLERQTLFFEASIQLPAAHLKMFGNTFASP